MNTKDFDWEREFDKLFMYDRGDYKEFDILKAGNVGVLIELIRTVRHRAIQADHQQLLKAVEEMLCTDKGHLDQGRSEQMHYGYNEAIREVIDLLKESDSDKAKD